MKKYMTTDVISTMGKEQLILLKKSMNKKSYKAYCRKFRNTISLGRNYGTREMMSARDIRLHVRNKNILDYEM